MDSGSKIKKQKKWKKMYIKYFGYKRVLDGFWARMDAGFEFSIKKRVY